VIKIISLLLLTGTLVWPQLRGQGDRRVLVSDQQPTPSQLATAMVVNSAAVMESSGGTRFFLRHANAGDMIGLCRDETFADQPQVHAANCSAVLVSEDVLLTAAHCADPFGDADTWCNSQVFLFGMTGQTIRSRNLPTDRHMYRCAQVLETGDYPDTGNLNGDWMLIQLERPVHSDFPPVNWRTSGGPSVRSSVHAVGHPQGLPALQSDGEVTYVDARRRGVQTNLDIFGGNSGGGVFNSDNELEGVMVTSYGASRPYFVEPSGCLRWAPADPVRELIFEDEVGQEWVTGAGFVPVGYFQEALQRHTRLQQMVEDPRGRPSRQ
jgi:hypothetical protein